MIDLDDVTDDAVWSPLESLQPWADRGMLGTAAVQAAARFASDQPWEVALALALAVEAVSHSDTCVDLGHIRDQMHHAGAASAREEWIGPHNATVPGDEWHELLMKSPLVATADEARRGTGSLLVLEQSQLFLRRLWLDECAVAEGLMALQARPPRDVSDTTAAFVAELVPEEPDDTAGAAAAREAVEASLAQSLTIITGGPGTGKTWTLARVLAAIWHQGPDARVALTAPTGKAAKRMRDAIDAARASLELPAAIAEQFADCEPRTLHRLLGLRPGEAPLHDGRNPIDADVVVVDEASMVSLPLMAQLVRALPDHVTLVLLGDPFQLASVEAGSVLGDLVSEGSAVAPCVVRLSVNHRSTPELDTLFRLVNSGDSRAVINRLSNGDGSSEHEEADPSVRWIRTGNAVQTADLIELLTTEPLAAVGAQAAGVVDAAASGDVVAADRAATSLKVLCATNRGPLGVDAWTEAVEAPLVSRRARHLAWYSGRPVLITRNDYVNGLFNGDTGITIGDQVVVVDETGEQRRFGVETLADVQTWWAMTIHKSQGSEFDHVVIAFTKPESGSSNVSRELLYTALTRARRRITLVCSEDALRWAVEHPIVRSSGLARRLQAQKG